MPFLDCVVPPLMHFYQFFLNRQNETGQRSDWRSCNTEKNLVFKPTCTEEEVILALAGSAAMTPQWDASVDM